MYAAQVTFHQFFVRGDVKKFKVLFTFFVEVNNNKMCIGGIIDLSDFQIYDRRMTTAGMS